MIKLFSPKKRLPVPGIVWGIIFLIIFFSIIRPAKFPTLYNALLILRHSSVLIVASIGMTMLILVSQIDLSVGSVMSLAGVITAVCAESGMPLGVSLALSILVGMLIGVVNGTMVAVFRFDYWISTFATMGIAAGLALVVANGQTITVRSDFFNWLGNGKVLGIDFLILLVAVLVAGMLFVLGKTRFGYNIYSIGGSAETARLSGIDVTKNRMFVFIGSGFFSAVAGLMLAAMGSSASPIAGADYSFDAIAAVIIGGTSFDGGKGGLAGTVLGAVLLRILTLGLNLMGIPPTWQKAIIGVVIVAIIVNDVLGERRRKTNESRRVYSNV
ncbi:MAG: ABC transporter permease [Spirochaetales bacterium]|jgi:ribose/xylose/arabinose/galactoside ABC-type transport system permease subunit|nr:ABC transporter permease [Spirochaetales bacterium]